MNFCKISKEWTFSVDEGFRKKVALKYKWNQFQDLNCKGRKGHAKLDNTDLNEEAELWRVQRTENLCQETQFKKKNKKKPCVWKLWVKISENPKDFQHNIRNLSFLSYKVSP